MKHPTRIQTPTQTQFLSVQDVATLVSKAGIAATLRRLADYIFDDYRRWQDFDKCARVASHSHDGVIELMPIADANTYAFKYVNGHPKNTRLGLPTVMAFGVLADVATGIPVLLTVGRRRARAGPAQQQNHGADRQRRAGGVSGAGVSLPAGH
jgi:ornithine cyclodeaminase